VVIANVDPFAAVQWNWNKVFTRFHGVDVTFGILEKEAAFINRRFFTFHTKKTALHYFEIGRKLKDGFMDIDRTDNPNTSYWITTPASKRLEVTNGEVKKTAFW